VGNGAYHKRAKKVPDQQSLQAREDPKRNQKKNINMRRGVRDLPELEEGALVWVPKK
jgi:hypothetical protein